MALYDDYDDYEHAIYGCCKSMNLWVDQDKVIWSMVLFMVIVVLLD